MKTSNYFILLATFLLLASCKDSKSKKSTNVIDDIINVVDNEDTSEVKFYNAPENCTEFLKSIDFSTFCLTKNTLKLNEHVTTKKGCSIDIGSKQLNGGNLDITLYYETNPDQIQNLKLVTEVQKNMVPNSTHQIIDGLGDTSFIVHRPMMNMKVLVMLIGNIQILITSEKVKGKDFCMYEDAQLENMGRAIVSKIY